MHLVCRMYSSYCLLLRIFTTPMIQKVLRCTLYTVCTLYSLYGLLRRMFTTSMMKVLQCTLYAVCTAHIVCFVGCLQLQLRRRYCRVPCMPYVQFILFASYDFYHSNDEEGIAVYLVHIYTVYIVCFVGCWVQIQ